MRTSYCRSCEQTTGFKRSIGIGTLLGAACTGGISLVATPFYPLRCVRCGSVKQPIVHRKVWTEERTIKATDTYDIWGIIILIALCALFSLAAALVKPHKG